MTEVPLDRLSFRTLLIALATGSLIFVLGLLALLTAMSLGEIRLDSSVVNFYQLMALAGAIFGFERCWAHGAGGVNPFND